MKKHTIARDGKRNLTFAGSVIGCGGGRIHNGREQNRFNELTLYKTEGGKYVLQEESHSDWQGESCSDDAHVFVTAQKLFDYLNSNEWDGENSGLSREAKELLEDAAKTEPDIAAVLIEEVD